MNLMDFIRSVDLLKYFSRFFSEKRYFISPNCYTIINFIPWLELWTDRQYGKRVIPSRTSKTWIFYDQFPRTPNRETLNMTHNSIFHEPEWNSGAPRSVGRLSAEETRISSAALRSPSAGNVSFFCSSKEKRGGRETTWPYHVDAHLKWHNYEATTSDAEHTTSWGGPSPQFVAIRLIIEYMMREICCTHH